MTSFAFGLWVRSPLRRIRDAPTGIGLTPACSKAGLKADNAIFGLALCGDGFRWHQDQLEDLVAFYTSGLYRGDDPFSQVERKYMTDQNISLTRTISRFAYFQRKQGEIRPNGVSGHVRPPRGPFF